MPLVLRGLHGVCFERYPPPPGYSRRCLPHLGDLIQGLVDILTGFLRGTRPAQRLNTGCLGRPLFSV